MLRQTLTDRFRYAFPSQIHISTWQIVLSHVISRHVLSHVISRFNYVGHESSFHHIVFFFIYLKEVSFNHASDYPLRGRLVAEDITVIFFINFNLLPEEERGISIEVEAKIRMNSGY